MFDDSAQQPGTSSEFPETGGSEWEWVEVHQLTVGEVYSFDPEGAAPWKILNIARPAHDVTVEVEHLNSGVVNKFGCLSALGPFYHRRPRNPSLTSGSIEFPVASKRPRPTGPIYWEDPSDPNRYRMNLGDGFERWDTFVKANPNLIIHGPGWEAKLLNTERPAPWKTGDVIHSAHMVEATVEHVGDGWTVIRWAAGGHLDLIVNYTGWTKVAPRLTIERREPRPGERFITGTVGPGGTDRTIWTIIEDSE